jgi:hypothetical protein
MKMLKDETPTPPRLTEFQRFAKAARKAGLIVSKKAYDTYFRPRAIGRTKPHPDKQPG